MGNKSVKGAEVNYLSSGFNVDHLTEKVQEAEVNYVSSESKVDHLTEKMQEAEVSYVSSESKVDHLTEKMQGSLSNDGTTKILLEIKEQIMALKERKEGEMDNNRRRKERLMEIEEKIKAVSEGTLFFNKKIKSCLPGNEWTDFLQNEQSHNEGTIESLLEYVKDLLSEEHKGERRKNEIGKKMEKEINDLITEARRYENAVGDLMNKVEDINQFIEEECTSDIKTQEMMKEIAEKITVHVDESRSTKCTEKKLEKIKEKIQALRKELLTYYIMDKTPRGKAVIINNVNFKTGKPRSGSDIDADNLEFLFRKLHFQVEKKKDLTSEEIIKVLRNISGESHREFNAFVCCILSHGSEGSVFGTDGEQVMIKDFLHFFKGHLCKTLAGKPKLFFIQACQGEDKHTAVKLENDNVASGGSNIPSEADMLLAMSTVPGYVSYRDPKEGSVFIQSLVKHLQNEYKEKHLLDILTLVSNEVSQMEPTQMPIKIDTLRKKVYFFNKRSESYFLKKADTKYEDPRLKVFGWYSARR